MRTSENKKSYEMNRIEMFFNQTEENLFVFEGDLLVLEDLDMYNEVVFLVQMIQLLNDSLILIKEFN
jgi:hypothetical protein